jgi:excisionase family DNA binding protein
MGCEGYRRRPSCGCAPRNRQHLLTSKHELSTQQAADLLGLSRTYVAQLINQGTLPAFHVGTHRRLRANDAIAYKQHRETRLDMKVSVDVSKYPKVKFRSPFESGNGTMRIKIEVNTYERSPALPLLRLPTP